MNSRPTTDGKEKPLDLVRGVRELCAGELVGDDKKRKERKEKRKKRSLSTDQGASVHRVKSDLRG